MTIFYVDSQDGRDEASGRSPAEAWRSLERLDTDEIRPGDSVLFRRGGLWRGQLRPRSGEPGQPVRYAGYGDGPLPILQNSVALNQHDDWEATERPHVWRTAARHAFACDIGNIIFDHGARRCGWKRWTPEDVSRPFDFWYSPEEQCVLLYCEGHPAEQFSSIEAAVNRVIVAQAGCHDIDYDGLAVRYGAGHGFGGGETKRLTIRNCDIYYIGGGHQFTNDQGRPVRFGNGIEFWNNGEDHLVENNRLWEIYDAALTNQGRAIEGFHSTQRNITWRNNIIWNAEYSFEYWNSPGSEITENILFEHNTCLNAGSGWGHEQRPDPNGAHLMFYSCVSQTHNFVIRDNIFHNSTEVCLRMCNDWRQNCQLLHNSWANHDGRNIVRFRTPEGDRRYSLGELDEFFLHS